MKSTLELSCRKKDVGRLGLWELNARVGVLCVREKNGFRKLQNEGILRGWMIEFSNLINVVTRDARSRRTARVLKTPRSDRGWCLLRSMSLRVVTSNFNILNSPRNATDEWSDFRDPAGAGTQMPHSGDFFRALVMTFREHKQPERIMAWCSLHCHWVTPPSRYEQQSLASCDQKQRNTNSCSFVHRKYGQTGPTLSASLKMKILSFTVLNYHAFQTCHKRCWFYC